jgi:hypothetical protein
MFMLDLKASGFGLVRLDYFANAMFSDPLTDKLYMTQTDGTYYILMETGDRVLMEDSGAIQTQGTD